MSTPKLTEAEGWARGYAAGPRGGEGREGEVVSEKSYERMQGPVHGWFELTYSSYQVLPRVLMQSMPTEWQERMVACMQEMREEFWHVEKPDSYQVIPCEWVEPGDLTESQRKALDIERVDIDEDGDELDEVIYYDRTGSELDRHLACVAVPMRETLPAYRHGYVPPASDGAQR